MGHLARLLFGIVYAAELIISPVPDGSVTLTNQPAEKPQISFGQLQVSLPVPSVLGAATDTSAKIVPDPQPQTRKAKKPSYTIALLGDSMIDTLGSGAPELTARLSRTYPDTQFVAYNYGAGGTNIENGLLRLTGEFSYLGQTQPPLVSRRPDIVVVESFGYNPFTYDEGALDRQWVLLAYIVDTVKTYLPDSRIIIAATIAPNAKVFGDGAPELSFTPDEKRKKVATIKQYLENAVRFAKSQNLPLADAYHASMDRTGNGKLEYINGGDHIHYSEVGRGFFASKLVDTIISRKLIE